ncbi:TRAP transporter substrate-binding protein DctP [Nocardiopsis synnemataformans]|uniref:TRAP transporter substrate-binding protein DctP n=1 Tax=Nocardiopsis synnemataformans TaxID=61305 RepID=UPI003EBB0A04
MNPARPSARRTRVVCGSALAASLLLTACGPGESDDGTITLRLAHYMPTSNINVSEGVEVWMREVEERTGGRVEFEYYPSSQLVSAEQIISSLRTGTVDVGAFVPATAAPAELPLSEVPTVPGYDASDLRVVQNAYQEMLAGPLAEEWGEAGIRPVMGMVPGRYQFLVQGEPRRTLDDWQGTSVRTPGGVADFLIEGMGAAPIAIPGPEQYEAMQRGTADSSLSSLEAVPAYGFHEVSDAATTNAPLGVVITVLGVSAETYEELPEDVRVAMSEASEVTLDSYQDAREIQLEDAVEVTSNDLEYYELGEGDLEDLQRAITEAQERWVQQREEHGQPGQEVLDAWYEALDRAEQER